MTDAHSPEHDPKKPGTGRVEIPLPEFPGDDEPVVMHEDFAQVARDTLGSYKAVCVLMDLLNGDCPEDLEQEDRIGLSVLLEGTRYRLELAVEGLKEIGRTMQLPSVLEAGA